MKKNKRIRLLKTLEEHIINNKKEYIIISLMFVIGIFFGVFFVNNMQETKTAEVSKFFNDYINKLKELEGLNTLNLLRESLIENFLLALAIWFFGTTVIGLPVVFGITLYRGFCIGYTIAVCILSLSMPKGLIFIFSSLLLQNTLFIPAILGLSVSGFKLYKSIVKNKDKENIKIEILRHTIFSLIMLAILVLSSIIEVFLSTNILKLIIKYF